MTIHRIVRDDSYLIFAIPHLEVMKKLGREYPIHIKRSPMKYAEVWKEPLFLDFGPENGNMHEQVPDLSIQNGRMFFSEKAFQVLSDDLSQDGEFLPVTHNDGTGYLFNPLVVAEEYDARNESVTTFNEYKEVQHLVFIEEKLPVDTMIFRSTVDTYQKIFCTDQFKEAVESAGLVGIFFHPDLAGIGGGAAVAH